LISAPSISIADVANFDSEDIVVANSLLVCEGKPIVLSTAVPQKFKIVSVGYAIRVLRGHREIVVRKLMRLDGSTTQAHGF
jgi:hypothetical protein